MKRPLLIVIALAICLFASANILAVGNPTFSVNIIGTPDADTTFNGQNTLVFDWQIITNKAGLTLRYAQGLRLAYDNTVLQLMKWDGSDVIEDGILSNNFNPVSIQAA